MVVSLQRTIEMQEQELKEMEQMKRPIGLDRDDERQAEPVKTEVTEPDGITAFRCASCGRIVDKPMARYVVGASALCDDCQVVSICWWRTDIARTARRFYPALTGAELDTYVDDIAHVMEKVGAPELADRFVGANPPDAFT
jgi:hypothetical protein